MSLKNKAMTVTLNISAWTARKYDRKVTTDVAERFNAEKDKSGNFNKQLIKKESIDKIQKVVSAARSFHGENTLPWGNNNDRLLPTTNYFEYMARIQEYKDDFEVAVRDFLCVYPTLQDEAKIRLGNMYKEEDYPEVGIVKGRYSFAVSVCGLADSSDFRVGLSEIEEDDIRASIEQSIEISTKNVMDDLWGRLFKVVNNMTERLSNPGNKFKDSLVGNIREVCDLLPRLNVTNDPELSEALEAVRDDLTDVDARTLRVNQDVRSETKEKAEAILEKMRGFIE